MNDAHSERYETLKKIWRALTKKAREDARFILIRATYRMTRTWRSPNLLMI